MKKISKILFLIVAVCLIACVFGACENGEVINGGEKNPGIAVTEQTLSEELQKAVEKIKEIESAIVDTEQKTISITIVNSVDSFDLNSISVAEGYTVNVYSDRDLTNVVAGIVDIAEGDNIYYLVASYEKVSVTYMLTVNRLQEVPSDHEHSFGAWTVVYDPTCTETGLKKRTCACGEEETEEIAALNHTLTHHEGKAATCTEIGWKAYDTCSRCDYTTYEEIETLDHDLVSHEGKEPTCTEAGWYAYDTCTRCDYTTYSAKQMRPHNFVNNVCSVCGLMRESENLHFSLLENDTYVVAGYGGNDKDIVILAEHEGKKVSGIKARAFRYDNSVETITFGEGMELEFIGEEAFSISKLTSINIPEGVSSIGKWAFRNCFNLTSVTIPSSVESIGEDAFAACEKLATVTLAEGSVLKTIGVGAFRSTGIKPLTLPETMEFIGSDAFYDCADMEFNEYKNACYLGTETNPYKFLVKVKDFNETAVTIHDDCAYLCDNAFYNYQLEISYVDTYERIGLSNSIATVTFSDKGKLTYVGAEAFSSCSDLSTLAIPAGVTSIGKYAFNWSGIETLVLPATLENIGDFICFYCENLTSLTIANGVKEIPAYAFANCSKLVTVELPDSVKVINGNAFEYCTALTTINIPYGVAAIKGGTFSACEKLTSITLPETVTSIDGYAFSESGLTSITLPGALREIGEKAFAESSALESINIPARVVSIGKEAFLNCASLAEVTFAPECVLESIGNSAFAQTAISSITLPSGLTTIGAAAFLECKELTSIAIPSGVTRIEYGTFCECVELASVTLHDDITAVGANAFRECSKLTFIKLPSKIVAIGPCCFYDCDELTSVEIPNGVTEIANSAFCGCEKLESVVIPDSVTIIGDHAFDCCIGLTSLTIGSNVEKIGINAFGDCHKLMTIIIPDSVKYIGKGSFATCKGVTSITIGNSVETIGWSAFSYTAITTLTIPASVTNIANDFVLGCEKLTEINFAGTEEQWIEATGGANYLDLGIDTSIVTVNFLG